MCWRPTRRCRWAGKGRAAEVVGLLSILAACTGLGFACALAQPSPVRQPSPQEPARGKGGPAGMFAGAAALLQLRLLEAYASLPSPAAYGGEQEALTKLCMRAVR